MKKKVLAVILLFLIGTFIVGCSGTITPKTTTPKEEFPSEADGRKCFENETCQIVSIEFSVLPLRQ